MKFIKIMALSMVCSSAAIAVGEEADLYDASEVPTSPAVIASDYQFPNGAATVLFDNGPLITSVGTGVGGEDESVLENTTLGMTTLGAGHTGAFRVADEFTITGDDWDITTITFFAYQTGATASTITEVNLQIWDGVPGAMGSSVIFGDDTTNRMSATSFSNILRVTEATTGTANNRQIAANIVDVNITLTAGTYWLDWQSNGSAGSGPWAPPVTITGQTVTGNAMQSNTGVWGPLNDGGTGTALGMPFIVEGSVVVSDADVQLTITNDAAGTIDLGDTITFSETVLNNGPGAATNTVVTSTIPSQLSYVSNDCGATLAGSSLTWNVGGLAASASQTCNVVTNVTGFGQIVFAGTVSADEIDMVAANNNGTSSINGPVQIIPTLGQYALILLALGLIVIGRRKFI
jgi:uncharacterized repeat protein (TIGR01451 family)